MTATTSTALVSTEWLAANLHDPRLRIVDLRWSNRIVDGRGEQFDDHEAYLRGHIPGAVFLGIGGELSDLAHPVPDMLVPPDDFARTMGRIGIGNQTHVIAYDDCGLPQSSARFWWALRHYGHESVSVLDGGLRQWRQEGRHVAAGSQAVEPAQFTPSVQPRWLAQREEVLRSLGQAGTTIVSCLPWDQHEGIVNYWGRRPGHIPGARNLPAYLQIDDGLATARFHERAALLQSRKSFVFRPFDELARIYQEAGVHPGDEIVAYCGRGFAAATCLLALHALGYPKLRLYDGSWAEWSADEQCPTECGDRYSYRTLARSMPVDDSAGGRRSGS